jgi:exodeoxyribonuclease V beta subunit
MKAAVTFLDQPLENLSFSGLHLIEASAGTGKTWTLSSLMVRILSEKYMPRQVIATTFTRAAAAELKTRIRLRLMELHQLTQSWQQLPVAEHASYVAQLSDPLAQVLFRHFAQDADGLAHFDYLHNRLQLVRDSLDELFVGTIDSFTQKLLREFSFESGEVRPRQLSDNDQQYPYQIAHDALRAWLQQQEQGLIDLLLASKALHSTEQYLQRISSMLNFSQLNVLPVTQPKLSLSTLEQCFWAFGQQPEHAFADFADYYRPEGAYAKAFNGNVWRAGVLESLLSQQLPALYAQAQQGQLRALFSPQSAEMFARLEKLQQAKGSKRGHEQVMQTLIAHPLLQCSFGLADALRQVQHQLAQLDDYLHYFLILQIQQQLPQVLAQAEETTFNQQTQTLATALTGDQGQSMAQAIVQRYPMILVDEFQDTSQEQDLMLQTIWRQKNHLATACFIAVGDPKQAIYGFRGGDILTYLNAFNDIASKNGRFYRLRHNFRSVAPLVSAVDALFLRQPDFGEQIDYTAALAGKAADRQLVEQQQADRSPLRWIHLEADSNQAWLIAQKIQYLLGLAQQQQLYLETPQRREAITADDIAVLAYRHHELELLEQQLQQRNIRVSRVALDSVFSSAVAVEIAAILQAMLQPDQEAVLRRALMSPLIGLRLSDFVHYRQQSEPFSQHMWQFRQARQLYSKKGFLVAWQVLAEHYQFWANLAAHSAQQAERNLVNARHIIELLSQQSRHYQGLQHLQQWYQLQLSAPLQRDWEMERQLSSESGVQLMTIHKSKGLEFKIVFLMTANKALSKPNDGAIFFADTQAGQSRRLIAVSKGQAQNHQAALVSHEQKLAAENHRLWYVALTRASYRLYIVLLAQAKTPEQPGGVDFWLKASDTAFVHPASVLEPAQSPEISYHPPKQSPSDLPATPCPQQFFYPKTRTSFSYLAAHIQHHAVDSFAEIADQPQAAADETDQPSPALLASPQTTPLAWIRQNFPRGTQAGNCLHGLLENLDFQDSQHWEQELNRQLYQSGLWPQLLAAYLQDFAAPSDEFAAKQQLLSWLKHWIGEILATPLQPDTRLALQDLSPSMRLSEFPFFLALAEQRFDSARLHQLFVAQGIPMPEFEAANSARYLNGAIDLVYSDGQRYYIADYKSNRLGADVLDYEPSHLAQNMTSSSYWLQASLYLVALHRYLGQQLAGYCPEQHLGGASYLYLRGMIGQAAYGVYYWPADVALILKLDQFLGQINPSPLVDNYV